MSSVENMRFRVKRAEEARKLIEQLFSRGFSQNEIAFHAGVSQPTISCYLKERIAPKPETLSKLRKYAREAGIQ